MAKIQERSADWKPPVVQNADSWRPTQQRGYLAATTQAALEITHLQGWCRQMPKLRTEPRLQPPAMLPTMGPCRKLPFKHKMQLPGRACPQEQPTCPHPPTALCIAQQQTPGADHLRVVQDVAEGQACGPRQLHCLRDGGQALQQGAQNTGTGCAVAGQAQAVCSCQPGPLLTLQRGKGQISKGSHEGQSQYLAERSPSLALRQWLEYTRGTEHHTAPGNVCVNTSRQP